MHREPGLAEINLGLLGEMLCSWLNSKLRGMRPRDHFLSGRIYCPFKPWIRR